MPNTKIALSVNLNKIALIRNSRDGDHPRVEDFGRLALDGGAAGLTVHPRPDQRHITPRDVRQLSSLVNQYAGREFNIEGNPFAPPLQDYPGLIELVRETRPDQCTLVPDGDEQKTSDHGFDLKKDGERLKPIIEELHSYGVRVSLFMDPDVEQIKLARAINADRIELYTGPFAWAYEDSPENAEALYQRHVEAAQTAIACGLGVNAGHDLNLENMRRYKELPGLLEVSIGHALTVDALLRGFTPIIQEYLDICS